MATESDDLDRSLVVANGFCRDVKDLIYCLEEDSFYKYKQGVYKQIYRKELQEMILENKSYTKTKNLNFLNNVIERIAMIKKCRFDTFNSHGYLNFENGLYDLVNDKLIPHSPDFICTSLLPYNYNPKDTCPLWEKTLNEIMENDKNKLRTLQEFFGYCLTREVKYEKALIMTGEGSNGKSVITNTLKHMVGPDNCSALSLKYFNNPQKISVIKNRLVNICTEVQQKIEDYESEFKTIVSGEDITISPKFIPDYTISPYCKLIFCVNTFPHIDDKTSAFYRRLLIIVLNRQFSEEEQNKNLREELLKELPGIFNWSLQGLQKLQERGTFIIDEYMKQAIEEIREMNNPIRLWAKDNLMVLRGDSLVKGDAFEAYQKWSEKNGYRPYGLAKFGAEVYKLFERYTEKSRRQGGGSRQWIWPNLAFRTAENELRAQQEPQDIEWTDDTTSQ